MSGAYVVTGGTGALGAEVVRALVSGGGRVAVPWRQEPAWNALRAALPEARLFGAAADMSDVAAAERFMDQAAAALDGIDGVAAVAGGFLGSGTLEQAPPGEWHDMIAANLGSAYATCRSALPHLLKRGGSVVTVASRLAADGGAGAAAYAVSKSAVMALTRVLALENRTRGVRFNCVLPGIIDTEANRRGMPRADRAAWTPASAVARLIVFLLTPGSAPMTGAMVPADGPAPD
jgi:NAD(P)-dependent dehydrogenase (short-subunit alcohol dehydrogenase family)